MSVFKMYKSGLSNKLELEIKFLSRSGKYQSRCMQHIHILSKHHKRILEWDVEYRSKYACDRWINDSRGCGYGCRVAKRRFEYK